MMLNEIDILFKVFVKLGMLKVCLIGGELML